MLPPCSRYFGWFGGRAGHSGHTCPLWSLGGRRRGGGGGRGCCRSQSQLFADFGFELDHGVFVFFEESAGVFAALADALTFIAIPGAGLLDDVMKSGDVEQIALARDAFAVHDVELGFAERC